MGPLGWQETVFIFVLALLIFGPKKLPELGRTLGKAMTEFRRASSELKATFDREMSSLERENESIKEVTSGFHPDAYNFDYNYDHNYDSHDAGYNPAPDDSTATEVSAVGASAPQGAESQSGAAPEGVVATTATASVAAEPAQLESGAPQPSNGTPSGEPRA